MSQVNGTDMAAEAMNDIQSDRDGLIEQISENDGKFSDGTKTHDVGEPAGAFVLDDMLEGQSSTMDALSSVESKNNQDAQKLQNKQ